MGEEVTNACVELKGIWKLNATLCPKYEIVCGLLGQGKSSDPLS